MSRDPVCLATLIQQHRADVGSLSRFYPLPASQTRIDRFDRLYASWEARLAEIDLQGLDSTNQLDLALLKNHLAFERSRLAIEAGVKAELRKTLPFADGIIALEEARMRMDEIDPVAAAQTVAALAETVAHMEDGVGGQLAIDLTAELREAIQRWFDYYTGYDPLFTWWLREPYRALDEALTAFEERLKETDDLAIAPIGREALLTDLAFEMIPYGPEELIAMGEREYAWCLAEMKRASAELGFGDDWKAALEHVKTLHLPPGAQTKMVRELALEAVDYLESRDLLTIPDLAKETWRMEMMAAERQLVSPFFLGGETIIVSYPTDEMSHARKLMSMRGNNPHFSRATVQHELIPGHHMQFFMMERHRPYRTLFDTPFWIEGWALYWEMLLWDLGFPRIPEERIGMLFWRMHRCVRVTFSLRFHLGELTPQECVEMLVDRVGHERANAEGEVRRSFNGTYPPLYQAAYLIGGLQFRAMRRELVDSGRMTDREFHDAILHENEMPVAMLRLALKGEPFESAGDWKFDA